MNIYVEKNVKQTYFITPFSTIKNISYCYTVLKMYLK